MENKLSDNIIEMVEEKLGCYPFLIQSGWYSEDVIMSLIEKGKKEIWSNSVIDDKIIRYEGIIEFSNDYSYIYYKRNEQDSTYWLVCLTNEDGREGIMFFVNNIKKLKVKLPW